MKTIKLTQEQASEILVEGKQNPWFTGWMNDPKNPEAPHNIFLHNKESEPITKEGIEGFGFKVIGLDAHEDYIQFEARFNNRDFWIEGNNQMNHFIIDGEYRLFMGKLETMQELKTVLKQVGVL